MQNPRHLLGFVLVGLFPVIAFGEYISIEISTDQPAQAPVYNANWRQLNLQAISPLGVILNDPFPLSGTFQDVSLQIVSAYDRTLEDNGEKLYVFSGGSFWLTFDFDDGGGRQSYEIAGTVAVLFARWTITGPTDNRLEMRGFWSVDTVNLPGSNDWSIYFVEPNSIIEKVILDLPNVGPDWDPETESITEFSTLGVKVTPKDGLLCCIFPKGDWDFDCDLDLADFAAMASCSRVADASFEKILTCYERMDMDATGYVNEDDVALFVDSITGPVTDTSPCGFRINRSAPDSREQSSASP